ncbi:MAG TPA: 16S rRNA (cytosine(1402)-N(4))-methyltransferase RsmH [Candidatus Moranbacteria bacterium]|jgi:16S rRNA (cytosine1402-N4)-methyltransferase|nr:16S rRNA (cytosine(1402)-N(4))-methyltransferase RsmH [Candidatus Moranbacteria bacterium]HPX93986.1 16S rRNA (cytosine(1402)-N(4))-methyltransferase RsmH [Candidatus Moranbacteria bacterium]HQB59287.1 16S rRNA (cytosine(1402)-N(4))-methyltransferase RsmH [Candidatus Moranbacteria bacterium]
MSIHKSVLVEETVDALKLKKGMVVVDATLGGGGHSREILKKIGNTGTLAAIDQDEEALKRFAKFTDDAKEAGGSGTKMTNVCLIHDNFKNLKNILADLKIEKVDAILADLGISSDQLEDESRGISFQSEGFLDMRMDRSKGITAADVLNTYKEDELKKILREYGNEQYANSIVRKIVARRKEKPVTWTSELVELIGNSVPSAYKHKKIHYATKTFQALRIEVNRELEALESFLSQAIETLKPGGRLAIITFHSGEDSLVKHTFRENARGCICPSEFPVCRCHRTPKVKLITRKPIAPGEDEISKNPRARSAKLRVIEKI